MLHKKHVLPIMLLLILLFSTPPTSASANGTAEIVDEQCIYNGGVCVVLTYTVDCNGYAWSSLVMMSYDPYGLSNGYFELHNGTWTRPGILESDQIVGTVDVVLHSDGSLVGQHDFTFTINEPNECLPSSRTLKPKYYMYTLRDSNQPDTWLPYCYVISNEGFPSVERQAQVCSVSGFDYQYQATELVFSGWVSMDSQGHPHYGWPAWKHDWYRPEFATH